MSVWFLNILPSGPEVDGKYSTDLFVNRAEAIFEYHKQADLKGNGKPWFTYLSFQAVHEPLQVRFKRREKRIVIFQAQQAVKSFCIILF